MNKEDNEADSEGETEAFQGVFTHVERKEGGIYSGLFKRTPGRPIFCQFNENVYQFSTKHRTSVLRIEGEVTERGEDGTPTGMFVTKIDEIPWTRGRVH